MAMNTGKNERQRFNEHTENEMHFCPKHDQGNNSLVLMLLLLLLLLLPLWLLYTVVFSVSIRLSLSLFSQRSQLFDK